MSLAEGEKLLIDFQQNVSNIFSSEVSMQLNSKVVKRRNQVQAFLKQVMQPAVWRHLLIIEKAVIIQGLLKLFYRKNYKACCQNLARQLVYSAKNGSFFVLTILIPIDNLVIESFAATADFIAEGCRGADSYTGRFYSIHGVNCNVEPLRDLVLTCDFE